MNKKILLSSMLCGLFFSPFAVQANDKVETVYNAQKFQQVCKGKTQGAPVSFAYRGIIWNGTCEPQFFSSSKAVQLQGNEPELYRSCMADAQSTVITVNSTELKGKCALGFTPPRPAAM
ncbi:hypothetical protein [Acinetobacter sp. ANC 5045]|uniref:hypothetical protein n=1 Tax=Acinetobacter sp. ANC 5045 TaxID=2529851 RepID=UPI00103F506E|nr:hypothetical protein [Acinetobacter sp. ANC 5045]TCB20352.1 hypothetical protein E0H79_03415 [Acinetobacter sp. ANC 5045]